MNNIKIIISILAIALLMGSCKDAIEIDQPGILEYKDLYKTVNDLQDGLSGVYSNIDNTNEIKFNSVYSDEVSIGVQSGGQAINEYALTLNSNSTSPFSIWVNNVIAIDRINRVLAAANNIVPTNDEVNQYNNIIGQLYGLRGYLHFILETYFSEDLTDDTKLGSVIMDRVFLLDESEIPRKTNAEVFEFIDNDLQMATDLMSPANTVIYFGLDAVKALKVRMYAYRGQYDLMETLANELLVAYPLQNQAKFSDIWTDNSNDGVIFKLERTRSDAYDNQATGMTGGGWAGAMYAFGISGGVQSAYLEMGRSLFNDISPNDIRYNSYIDHTTSVIDPNYITSPNVIQSDVLAIGKYLGSEDQVLMNDLKIFRSAEVLFLLAEAKANAHQYSDVANLLKQLRDLRFNDDTTLLTLTNDEEAFGAILNERKIELCFEGFRWVDLKRLGVKANQQIERDARDCELNGVCTMDKLDHRFTLPIPLRELDNNVNLKQNTGY